MSYYKKCFVPTCTNTWRNTPSKVFVIVRDTLKKKWCRKLNIEFEPKRRYYCCEDHLNLEEDLENYQYWKLMKGRPSLKSTASLYLKTPCASSSTINVSTQDIEVYESSQDTRPSELQRLLESKENLPSHQHRSKCSASLTSVSKSINVVDVAVQCSIKMADKSTNFIARKFAPSQASYSTLRSLTVLSSPAASVSPSLFGCTSETETTSVDKGKELKLRGYFLSLVYKNPQRYLGVPKRFMWMLKYVCENSKKKVTELDIIITLFKIRQNDSMIRISEQFEVSLSALTNIFTKSIESLANFFQNLIYLPSPIEIKKQLPLVFKTRYSNVQCILDCFEIEIEKPSDPLRQAQTWSQYKNCNTIKYLIGCTPNGLVAYISKGYGGRISDKAILEKGDLIDILPFNAVVMADRGFKEVETHLMTKGIKLLRPPSVYSGIKPTKEQVVETKVIASLRVHVERVIRRVREFRLLKPHSVVKYNHVGYMDQIVIIACGLINLQKEIIKSE